MNDFATMTPEMDRAFTAWSGPQPSSQRPVEEPAPITSTQETEASRLAQAHEAGRLEAEAAHTEALHELKESTARLQEALEQVERIRREALSENAALVGAMITTVTERVLGASLALHPDALPRLVRNTLEQMPARDGLTVSVPAAQAERIQRSIGAELGVQIIPDIHLQDGCLVRSEGVHIEATVASVMEGVEAAVSEWTKQQSPPLHHVE